LTGALAAHYSFQMSDQDRTMNAEQELRLLEARIDELLTSLQQLHEENRALRQRHESLASEKTSLLNRNDQVRARVEAMIGRLKAMEHGA
jgi:cell division protein ZapB